MAGIDWSQLGGMPAPRVVGSIPASPDAGANTMNSLIGGLQQGMQDARQGQLTQQQIQNAQTVNSINQIKLQQAQQYQAHQNDLTNALKTGGPDAMYKAMTPQEQMSFDSSKTALQRSQAALANDLMKNKEQAYSLKQTGMNYDDIAALHQASMYSTIQQQKNPEEAYQWYKSKMSKDVQDSMPAHYNQMDATYAISRGHQLLQDEQTQANIKASASGKGSDSKSGAASTKNPFDNAAAVQQQKQNAGFDSSEVGLNSLETATQEGLQVLDKIPKSYIGPVSGRVGLGFENTDVQKLDKILAGIPLVQKSTTLGQTAGARLFQSELEQMKTASGSKNINVPALRWILTKQHEQVEMMKYDNWQKAYSNEKNTSPAVLQNWLSSHQQPDDPRIQVSNANGGNKGTVPYSQLKEFLKAHPDMMRY